MDREEGRLLVERNGFQGNLEDPSTLQEPPGSAARVGRVCLDLCAVNGDLFHAYQTRLFRQPTDLNKNVPQSGHTAPRDTRGVQVPDGSHFYVAIFFIPNLPNTLCSPHTGIGLQTISFD